MKNLKHSLVLFSSMLFMLNLPTLAATQTIIDDTFDDGNLATNPGVGNGFDVFLASAGGPPLSASEAGGKAILDASVPSGNAFGSMISKSADEFDAFQSGATTRITLVFDSITRTGNGLDARRTYVGVKRNTDDNVFPQNAPGAWITVAGAAPGAFPFPVRGELLFSSTVGVISIVATWDWDEASVDDGVTLTLELDAANYALTITDANISNLSGSLSGAVPANMPALVDVAVLTQASKNPGQTIRNEIEEIKVETVAPSNADVINEACAAIQVLIDDPATDPDALGALQDAKDALEFAEDGEIEDMLNAMRDAAEALEEAREDTDGTDPIASSLADLARRIAEEKKEEALACDASPSGKMADDIEDGDKDLADGDDEYADGYFGDAIKDYRKAWEDYCDALDRCAPPKAASSNQFSVSGEQIVVSEFALHQNYPNPFNPSTTIQLDLIEAGNVSLNIYNSAGQLVRTLVSSEMSAGRHSVVWNAMDDSGARVASGLYLYALKAGSFTMQKKLVLMK